MSKKLCKHSKSDYKEKEYEALVKGAKYICQKCGRAAKAKKNVCKPSER